MEWPRPPWQVIGESRFCGRAKILVLTFCARQETILVIWFVKHLLDDLSKILTQKRLKTVKFEFKGRFVGDSGAVSPPPKKVNWRHCLGTEWKPQALEGMLWSGCQHIL